MKPTAAELEAALDDAAATGLTASLVEAWSQSVDAAMVERLAGLDLKALPIRQRIRTAVLTRLDILKDHKVTARKAALFLALPHHAPLGVRLAANTADAMWRAAGDTATDFNWYSKRAILAAVYATTEVAWFGDDTSDGSGAATFLDARIENVMQYEKLKARLAAAFAITEKSSR